MFLNFIHLLSFIKSQIQPKKYVGGIFFPRPKQPIQNLAASFKTVSQNSKFRPKFEVIFMRQKLFLLFVVCFVCLLSAEAQTVIEAESNAVFNENSANIALTVENPSRTFDGKIELELLDAGSVIRAKTSTNIRLENGKKSYNLTLPLGDLMAKGENDLAWFRLRYRIGETRGIVSLSQIIRDIFELRVIASDNLLSGMTYRSRVRALNPFTRSSGRRCQNRRGFGVGIKRRKRAKTKTQRNRAKPTRKVLQLSIFRFRLTRILTAAA